MLLEKTQRRACRILFIVGCVLPTLAVAGYTAKRLDSTFNTSLLAAASQRLGIRVASETISTPRPGVYVLDTVRLSTGSTDETVLTCGSLRLQKETDGWHFAASKVAIHEPTNASAALGSLLNSDLIAGGQIAGLRLDDITTFEQVTLSLGLDAAGARRLLLTSTDGVRFEALMDDVTSRVVADSKSHTIPAAWLPGRPLKPFDETTARFSGQFVAQMPRDGGPASGAATGRFEMRSISTPELEATAGSVTIDDLAWGQDRLVRFFGQIDLRNGRMSRPLVYGACCHLGLEPLGTMEAQYAAPTKEAWFSFTQLACDMELDAKGLVLVAGCGEIDGRQRGGAVAHAVVEHEGVALLREPRSKHPLPTQRLVSAWHPDDPAEMPATAAAIEMANRLPGASSR